MIRIYFKKTLAVSKFTKDKILRVSVLDGLGFSRNFVDVEAIRFDPELRIAIFTVNLTDESTVTINMPVENIEYWRDIPSS